MLNCFRVLLKFRNNRPVYWQSSFFSSNIRCKPKLRIVFGSQTGTAEAFAKDLEYDATEQNFEAEVVDAKDFSIKDLASPTSNQPVSPITAFLMATYGEGQPTDNAKKLLQELSGNVPNLNELKSCNYAVFGLGNSQFTGSGLEDRYNVVGKALDAKLNSLGAKRVLPIGLGDASANTSAAFNEWKKHFLEEAKNLSNHSEQMLEFRKGKSGENIQDIKNIATNKLLSSEHHHDQIDSAMFPLSIRQQSMAPANRPILISTVSDVHQALCHYDEFNSAYHITIGMTNSRPLNPACSDLKGAIFAQGVTPGDHIGIFSPNSNRIIEKFIVSAGLQLSDLDNKISDISPSISSSSIPTLRQVLTWQIQLTGIVPLTSLKILQHWAREQSMTLTADHLQSLVDEYDSKTQKRGLDIATILEMIPPSPRYPALPLVTLLKSLPFIAPRMYSITTIKRDHMQPINSSINNNVSVSILCQLLRYRQKSTDRIVDGLCSSYLCERLKVSDEIVMFFS